jgi:pyrroloquinoline quinone (PQQ) biosynthesis protein C
MAKRRLRLKKRSGSKRKKLSQKIKAVKALSVSRRYSLKEAGRIVDQAWEISLKDAFKRVWEHPFTRELEAGTLPIEVIRGFICNWYTAAQEINASSASGFYFNRHLCSQIPEMEQARAEGTADEFTAPGPGGHQRTIEGVASALGISREKLIYYPLIPEARAYLDNLVCVLTEPGRAGSINIHEERLAEWFKIWSRSLVAHYGLKPQDIFYFTMHAEADSGGQHYGGPVIGEDVMGHADRNRYIARRILEAGLGPPDPLRFWPEIMRWGTDMFLLLLDGCYERYYPQARSKQVVNQ